MQDRLSEDTMREYRYFRGNANRMRYDEDRANEWFVGSGVIESGCATDSTSCLLNKAYDGLSQWMVVRGEGSQRLVWKGGRPTERISRRQKAPLMWGSLNWVSPSLFVEVVDEDYFNDDEWHVIVTDLDMDSMDVLSLYHDCGDCENVFDEMKNQWGGVDSPRTHSSRWYFAAIVADLWNIPHATLRGKTAPRGRHLPTSPPVVYYQNIAPHPEGERSRSTR